MSYRLVGPKKAITSPRPTGIENYLFFIGRLKPLLTRNMPGNQPISIHFLQERRYIGQAAIPAPHQGMSGPSQT